MKTLRVRCGFSQEQFARVLGLSKSNVSSYEKGAFPRIEKFIEIMDYFGLDPGKFILLDMEQHSLHRSAATTQPNEGVNDQKDTTKQSDLPDQQQLQFLDHLSKKELKNLCIHQCQAKDQILKENLILKARYIKQLEERAK